MNNVIHGDLGTSYRTGEPVTDIAKKKFNDLNARDVDHASRIIAGTARWVSHAGRAE